MARPRTITALFTRARQRQQVLFDWMRSHHDDLAAELARDRGRWDQALQVIAGLKLVDDRGNPPTRDTVVRTWKRVRDDVAAARARQDAARSGQALVPGEVAPGVRAATLPQASPPLPPAGLNASRAPTAAMPREGGQPAALSDEEVQRVLDDLAQKQGGPRLPLPRIM